MKLLYIIVFIGMMGCNRVSNRAFKHAEEANPLCDVLEVSKTSEEVTVDVYCGCGYPERRTYRKVKNVQ